MAEQGEEGGEVLLQAHVPRGTTIRKPRKRTKSFPNPDHHQEQGPARAQRQYVIGPLWVVEGGGLMVDEVGQPIEVIFLDP